MNLSFGVYGLYDVVLLFHFEVLKGFSIIFRHEIYITGCLGSFGLFRSTCYFIMHWIESAVNKIVCVAQFDMELYKLLSLFSDLGFLQGVKLDYCYTMGYTTSMLWKVCFLPHTKYILNVRVGWFSNVVRQTFLLPSTLGLPLIGFSQLVLYGWNFNPIPLGQIVKFLNPDLAGLRNTS